MGEMAQGRAMEADRTMYVLHLIWAREQLHVWAESEMRLRSLHERNQNASIPNVLQNGVALSSAEPNNLTLTAHLNNSEEDNDSDAGGTSTLTQSTVLAHPFVLDSTELRTLLVQIGMLPTLLETYDQDQSLQLRLPCDEELPHASPRISGVANAAGFDDDDDIDEIGAEDDFESVVGSDLESGSEDLAPLVDAVIDEVLESESAAEPDSETDVLALEWNTYSIPTVTVAPSHALAFMSQLQDVVETNEWCLAQTTQFWITAGRFLNGLLVNQRIVPSMSHQMGKGLSASWRLWLHDDDLRRRVSVLLRQMPPVLRNVVGPSAIENPWDILKDMLTVVTDATIRRYFHHEELADAIEDIEPTDDVHVAWLSGLLDHSPRVPTPAGAHDAEVLGQVRGWLGRLADTGKGQEFCLRLVLEEPEDLPSPDQPSAPGADVVWRLAFYLESTADETAVIDAEKIWTLQGDIHFVKGHRLDNPHDALLRELARAGSIYEEIQKALEESQPTHMELTTAKAHVFMRDMHPLLRESGFTVIVPEWWDQPEARLAARLLVESDELPDDISTELGFSATGKPNVGLESFVKCSWRIALGEHTLNEDEFRWLSKQTSPLVRLRGQWVEVRSSDIQTALRFFGDSSEEHVALREALRLAYGPESETAIGLPVVGMDATGWVGQLFGSTGDQSDRPTTQGQSKGETIRPVPQPEKFLGTLRPYQLRGLSWFAFLERFGLGGILADDMGLGKTIQFIALLLRERELAGEMASRIGPTLLIVPTSVVGNWVREVKRFGPSLRTLVHHGADRCAGESLSEIITKHDVIVTTYALAYRDREDLGKIQWWRVCLDEAQNIKNPSAKQTKAIRSFDSMRRVALTGTPVENRLNELWSIMEFCNPGYLGPPSEFRRQFSIPIERYSDRNAVVRLRGYVQPFVLRRLKTDPRVIADLPEKQEYKVYCALTTEQAKLYEETVERMLGDADASDGIRRRGVVLSLLIKLKQICNHPAHFTKKKKEDPWASAAGQARRSGKTARMMEMLEEVVAEGDSALVFTQFREMGNLLSSLLQHDLGIQPLFLHGGVPQKQREVLVDKFQERDGRHPVFILSLKAGGIGLNLTAANHVFHFDRWWNPAIENQATDRAFRIGQTRRVQVHKFVCSGTIEERIDQMLEQKTELATSVIGSGEQWLTELSTDRLRDILALQREDITEDDAIENQYDNESLTQDASEILGG